LGLGLGLGLGLVSTVAPAIFLQSSMMRDSEGSRKVTYMLGPG
jgi:hypothetical protein